MNNKATYKISELPSTTDYFSGNEMIEISVPISNNEFSSKKIQNNTIGNFLGNNLLLNQLETENKTIVRAINELNISGEDAAPIHNSIYRGKWLGISPTQNQYQAIFNGTFDDLYVGDFWSEDPDDPSKTRWRIAGFNYYYGTGNTTTVLTNHAVIIPDTPLISGFNAGGIVDGSGITALGGYKYSYIRNYKTASSSINTSSANITSFQVNYIPDYVCSVKARIVVPTSQGDVGIDTYWEIDTEHTGEDPNNPGHGIVTIYGGNRYIVAGGYHLDIVPSINGIPTNTNVTIYYKYYDENYTTPMKTVKETIRETFGSEHIMHHEIPLDVQVWYGNLNGTFCGNYYKKVWTDTDIEIPTAECILGHAGMATYNEHLLNEVYAQQTNPALPEYVDKITYSYIDYNRPPYNLPESHLESSQLPLFVYDHSIIHTRAGYWFRNLGTNDNGLYPSGYSRDYSYCARYMYMTPYGDQWIYSYQSSGEAGIRPMFCISATSEPNILPNNI